jgi:hypothetical protein
MKTYKEIINLQKQNNSDVLAPAINKKSHGPQIPEAKILIAKKKPDTIIQRLTDKFESKHDLNISYAQIGLKLGGKNLQISDYHCFRNPSFKL